jgi:putative ABC transport system permease protein
VLLTVAFAMFIAGNVQTSTNAYADRRADAVRADAMLVPDGTPGLTDAASPDAPLPTDVYIGTTVVSALGVNPRAAAATVPGIAAAAQALTAPGSVLVTRSRMEQLGVTVGSTIDVRLADGNSPSLRIAGVIPDGSLPADLVINRAAVRAHDPSALAPAMPLPQGSAAMRVPGARIVDVAAWAREADSEEDRLVRIFTLLLIGVSVGYGALAVANTLMMATARRAPDYRLLRLAGATPQQVLITVAAESAVVVGIGSLIGGSAALIGLWGTVQGLRAQTSTSVDLSVPWSAAAIAVSACLVLALLASVLPARLRLTATTLAATTAH